MAGKRERSRRMIDIARVGLVIVLLGAWFGAPPGRAQATIPAFPGAEGFGANSAGGRGGRMIEVTNLANSGPGSLREALTAKGARIVVFRVGGRIDLTEGISISNPFLTIAGQTAPGDGICITGAEITIATHDVVIRYVRFRPGDDSRGSNPVSRDGVQIVPGRGAAFNIIIDHCSFSWAVDENTSTWAGRRGTLRDVTLQWNIISEGLAESIHPEGIHSMGLLVGERTKRMSIHHNLFAHNNGRNPVIQPNTMTEIVNNVVANYGYEGIAVNDQSSAFGRWKPLATNIIGNSIVRGADSSTSRNGILIWGGRERSKVYVAGNIGPGRPTDSGPE